MNPKPTKISAMMWGSYIPAFLAAAKKLPDVVFSLFSIKEAVRDGSLVDDFLQTAQTADVILLHWTHDGFWENVRLFLEDTGKEKTVVIVGSDPTYWHLTTGGMKKAAQAHEYIAQGGPENCQRLLEFACALHHKTEDFLPPAILPAQGILSYPDWQVYEKWEEYVKNHPTDQKIPTVGLLLSRSALTETEPELEKELIFALQEKGVEVLTVFSNYQESAAINAIGPLETGKKYFLNEDGSSRIDALVNLQFSFLDKALSFTTDQIAERTIAFFKQLNVPSFKPVVSWFQSKEEWEENPQGLMSQVAFSVALPEFEGNIEPYVMATSRRIEDAQTDTVFEVREILKDRIERISSRIVKWTKLSRKSVKDKKIVIVLHKNECVGLEGSIGVGAGLDTGESVIAILKQLQAVGYPITEFPSSGNELFQMILEKKAIFEFRWTTVGEIVQKGGYLAKISKEQYQAWFDRLPEKAKKEQIAAWGNPPGEEKDGAPPAMLYDGELIITGLDFGSVKIMVQPKRGCAGSRCDGQVCKLLHDAAVPPPHHFIATYRYMEEIFGADVVLHVGTHGSLEFLPGKGAGLSSSCWPDIALGNMPHLYIYNANNPAEGVIAKRRSHAVLLNHLPAPMETSDTYGNLAHLQELLAEYDRAKEMDAARSHQLEHLIEEAREECHLEKEMMGLSFEEKVEKCHKIISRVSNSKTHVGLHRFGDIPKGSHKINLILNILRFDTKQQNNILRLVFLLWGEDIDLAMMDAAGIGNGGKRYDELLFTADQLAQEIVERLFAGEKIETIIAPFSPKEELLEMFQEFESFVQEISKRVSASDEMASLENGLNAGYIPAGPSGFISRGKWDILPTGRNFYNVDPSRIPTQAAWRVGVLLAEGVLEKYLKEEGRYPEQVGLVWMAADIMRADGEQIGQILHLLGVRPTWKANGQLDGFEILPTAQLKRPRIDVYVRVSGISRDCFPASIAYLDRVISAVAALDETPEENYVRKHLLENLSGTTEDENSFRKNTYRIFSAQPGAYKAGVNLAVYASAWEAENDLADVYLYWNGYAYGDSKTDEFGIAAHELLVKNLKRVEVTFDKHISDESDFLACCGFFANYGGMTAASHAISGKKPKTYYGDTRNPGDVSVRDFSDELSRVVRTKLLHPKAIEGLKAHGYKGAGDLSKSVGRVYGFAATTGEVENWIFDEITETFVLNEEMRQWFQENNPWAFEEMARRLLEADARNLWQPSPEILEQLQEAYLEVEASIEETLSDTTEEYQGGSVSAFTVEEMNVWKKEMRALRNSDGLKK